MAIETGENQWSDVFFHHAIELDYCQPTMLRPNPAIFEQKEPEDTDVIFQAVNQWVTNEVGFYPLYLAIGNTERDVRITGYQSNWYKLLTKTNEGNLYRKKGVIQNLVLFSYRDQPTCIYMDYIDFHILLNSGWKHYQLSEGEKRQIFHPSWKRSDWLREARKHPGTVQGVVPTLNLAAADTICVRNNGTKKELSRRGFPALNIVVRRMAVNT